MAAEPPPGRAGRLAQAAGPAFSLQASVGGVRGIIESVLPYTVFSLVYAATKDLQTSIVAAGAPLVVLVIWRLIARETLTQAVSGVLGILLGAYFAQKSGKAADFFLPNILKNIGFAALYAASNLVRWPLIGVVIGPVTGEMFAWRLDKPRYAAYWWATWIWVGLFLVRLAVQVPLFLADNVTLLGTLNGLVLGVPLFALTIWLSWLVLKSVPLAKPAVLVDQVEPTPAEDPV
jgi:MFS family permease